MKTIWVLVGTISSLLFWEAYTLKSPKHKTISKVMLNESIDHPTIAFMLGMLMGHFFWSQKVVVDIAGNRTNDLKKQKVV